MTPAQTQFHTEKQTRTDIDTGKEKNRQTKGHRQKKHMSHISEFNLLNVGTRTLSNQPVGEFRIYECWASLSVQGPARLEH